MADDLFKFLDASNTEEGFRMVDKMGDDSVKSISPYVLLGWGHGARNDTETHAILTNEMLNPYVFSLAKHPKLLLKLFVAANSDIGNTRYSFVKFTGKEETAIIKLIARHYGVGIREAKDYRKLLSEKDIKIIKEMYQE